MPASSAWQAHSMDGYLIGTGKMLACNPYDEACQECHIMAMWCDLGNLSQLTSTVVGGLSKQLGVDQDRMEHPSAPAMGYGTDTIISVGYTSKSCSYNAMYVFGNIRCSAMYDVLDSTSSRTRSSMQKAFSCWCRLHQYDMNDIDCILNSISI